jgi:hypothetical protein
MSQTQHGPMNLWDRCTCLLLQIDTLVSWGRIVSLDAAVKAVPTVSTALLMIWTMHRFSHPLVLPAVLFAVPLAFHCVLYLAGWSLTDAQAGGWVIPPTVSSVLAWYCYRGSVAAWFGHVK